MNNEEIQEEGPEPRETPEALPVFAVDVSGIKPHPDNYREHPQDQIEHIIASIEATGFYRNIVLSADGYVLAGHGALEAAKQLGMEQLPAVRVSVGHKHPKALALLAGDNFIAHLSEDDDRKLTDMLRELHNDVGLMGTGFDESMVAALAMVTRTKAEIGDIDEAEAWAEGGMDDFEKPEAMVKLTLSFPDEAARDALVEQLELVDARMNGGALCARYPPRANEDVSSIMLEG